MFSKSFPLSSYSLILGSFTFWLLHCRVQCRRRLTRDVACHQGIARRQLGEARGLEFGVGLVALYLEGRTLQCRGVVTGLNLAGMNLGGIIPDDIPKSYHVREEMLLVLCIAVLCTAKSPKDRPTMRDVVTMLAEAKPRRKSSSATVGATVVDKDKPVFTTSPDSGYL